MRTEHCLSHNQLTNIGGDVKINLFEVWTVLQAVKKHLKQFG